MLPTDDRIRYLIGRRFPDFLIRINAIGKRRDPSLVPEFERGEELKTYLASLSYLSEEELNNLYAEQKSAEEAEAKATSEAEEAARMFNRPQAMADLDHWSKAAQWSLDEAVALSFGKQPGVVSWITLEPDLFKSAFASLYWRRRDLTLRAKAQGYLTDPVKPGRFLGWAKQYDISYPDELEKLVKARGNDIENWQETIDQLQAAHKDHLSALERNIESQQSQLAKLTTERDALLAKIEELEATDRSGSVSTKERESLLRLVAAMAVRGYSYDPNVKRNSATTDIAHDLEHLGIPLDPGTIRKWLKQSMDLLPPEALDDTGP